MKTSNAIPEFGIPRENEERRDGGLAIVFDPEKQRYAVGLQKSGLLRLFSGGVDDGEDIEQAHFAKSAKRVDFMNFSMWRK